MMSSLVRDGALHAKVFPVLVAGLIAWSSIAASQTPVTSLASGRTGRIYFASVATSAVDFPNGNAPATQTVYGDLLMPPNPSGRIPAMVILHGSEGSSYDQYVIAQAFNQMGVAAFLLDIYTPRGIPLSNARQTNPEVFTADAFYALKLLTTHPGIDPQRIGVIGNSRGAWATVYTTFENWAATVLGAGGTRFALHVAVSPLCTGIVNLFGAAPLRIHIGDRDNTQSVSGCQSMADAMRARGADVGLTVYPGAGHGFQTRGVSATTTAVAVNVVNCSYLYNFSTNTYLRLDTGQTATGSSLPAYIASCQTTELTVSGTMESARTDFYQRLRATVQQTFGLNAATATVSSPSDADRLFNFGEGNYRTLLIGRSATSQASGYDYRCYSQSQNCVGAKAGRVYYLDLNTGQLVDVGDFTGLLGRAIAQGF